MFAVFVPTRSGLGRFLSRCARVATLAALFGAVSSACVAPAHAQTLSPLPAEVHNAGQTIYSAVTQADGKVLVSGVFSEIGSTPWATLARFNTDGTLDTTLTVPSGDGLFFEHMAIYGSTLYVSGQFITLNGVAHAGLAAINLSDGSVQAWNPAPDGQVTSLAISGNVLYVGGTFTHIAGVARNSLAAFTLPNNSITGWNPNAVYSGGPDAITAILPAGSSVYLAGYFDSVGSQPRLGLAQVDSSSGAVSAWNPQQSIYAFPMTLALYGNTVFAGGELRIGGNWYGFAALDATTGAVKFGENRGDVYDLFVSGSTVYADGAFTQIGGAARAGLGAFDAVTGQATAWNPVTTQPSGGVSVLGQSGSWLLLGGSAQAFNGAWTGPFIRVDATTGAVASTTPVRYKAQVNALLRQDDGKVLVGGRFTEINGVERQNLARLNADGSVDPNWNPGASYDVDLLAASPTTVYISSISNQLTIGGQPRKYLGAVDMASGAATAWNPTPNSAVLSLLYANAQLYVGGFFTTIGGAQRSGLASFDGPSSLVTTFGASTDGRVLALAYDAGHVYIGGDFGHVNSMAHTLIAQLDATTGNVATWDPGALAGLGYTVNSLLVSNNQLLVGGNFQSMGGIARPNLVALNLSTAHATSWTPGSVNGTVSSIVPAGNTLYLGGGFSQIGVSFHPYMAAVDAATGVPHADWIPATPNNGVNAIAVSGGLVFAGGGFSALGGTARNALAAFSAVDKIFADGFQ